MEAEITPNKTNEKMIKQIKKSIKMSKSRFLSSEQMLNKNKKYNKYISNYIKTESNHITFVKTKIDNLSKQKDNEKIKNHLNENFKTEFTFLNCITSNSPVNIKNRKLSASLNLNKSNTGVKLLSKSLIVKSEDTLDNENLKIKKFEKNLNSTFDLKDVEKVLHRTIDKLNPKNLLPKNSPTKNKLKQSTENKKKSLKSSIRSYSAKNNKETANKAQHKYEDENTTNFKAIYRELLKKWNLDALDFTSIKEIKKEKSKYELKLEYLFEDSKTCAYEFLANNPFYQSKERKMHKKLTTLYKFFGENNKSINYTPTCWDNTSYEKEYRFLKIKEEAFALILIFNNIKENIYRNYGLLYEEVVERINIHLDRSSRTNILNDEFKNDLKTSDYISSKFVGLVKFYESESDYFVNMFKKTINEMQSVKKNIFSEDTVPTFFRELTGLHSTIQHLSNKFWDENHKLNLLFIKYLK